jgi:hypothetical protein
MDAIKEKARRLKNHLETNKFGYGMLALAIAAVALQQKNLKDFNEFLDDEGIDPMKFYCPEAYEELNP